MLFCAWCTELGATQHAQAAVLRRRGGAGSEGRKLMGFQRRSASTPRVQKAPSRSPAAVAAPAKP
eukprot:7431343-Alexandrium_andersonii.AAC.1